MKTISEKNVMVFKDDKEFEDFAVSGTEISDTGETKYFGVKFTDMYEEAVENGTRFIIEDDNSKVYKHKCVSRNSVTRYVSNLMPNYFLKLWEKCK